MDQTITQWPQGIGIVESTKLSAEKKPRPEKELALNCPRCNSINTKFCYYNNYNLSQPRYFCKTCRRYWTRGGSLRNVPVGGGSRKNKRISSSNNNNSSISSKKLIQSPQNPKIHEGQDLNLAYNPPNYNGIFGLNLNPNLDHSSSSSQIPVMEILKAGNMSSMGLGLSSFMGSESNSVYNGVSSGFALHDGFKQSLSFSLDGINENGFGNLVQDHVNNSRMPFPFEELKQSVSTNDQFDHQDRGNVGSESNGYWTGMLNGGSW